MLGNHTEIGYDGCQRFHTCFGVKSTHVPQLCREVGSPLPGSLFEGAEGAVAGSLFEGAEGAVAGSLFEGAEGAVAGSLFERHAEGTAASSLFEGCRWFPVREAEGAVAGSLFERHAEGTAASSLFEGVEGGVTSSLCERRRGLSLVSCSRGR